MTDLIARLIPLALGVAASPLPILAVLVVLLGGRARIGSLVLAASWVLGIVVALAIAVVFAGKIPPPRQGLDLPFEGLITALVGVGLIITAVISRRGRFRSEDPFKPPAWVAAIDGMSPFGGAIVAFTNATTSPKNLALAIAAGLAIENAHLRQSELLTAEIVYVIVAAVTVVAPALTYLVGGTRSEETLARWKAVVTTRAAGTMELTLLILGVLLAGKGIYNLVGAFS